MISLNDALRVIGTAALTYAAIVALVRISGKRTTSQMNNFDWIVTVTLGSIAGSTILVKDVKLMEGVLAITTLLLLQFLLTKGVRRYGWLSSLVKSSPTTLYDGSGWNETEMEQERIAKAEVLAAVRHEGFDTLEDVERVILETDATLSVIPAR